MKQISVTIIFSCLLFVFSISLAQAKAGESSSSGSVTTNTKKLDLKEKLLQRKDEYEKRKHELEERLKQKRLEIKDKRMQQISERFEKLMKNRRDHLQRLDSAYDKLVSRIEKLKARGVDTSTAEEMLAACGPKKTAALATINASEDALKNLDFNSTTAKDQANAQVHAIQQGNAAVKSYYECLTGVVKTLKATKGVEDLESQKPTATP